MMYDRMKRFLMGCVDVLILLLMLGAMGAYVMITSLIVTAVINDLRLDAYITYDTGFGIVMLIFLLGWAPVWLYKNLTRTRYSGKL